MDDEMTTEQTETFTAEYFTDGIAVRSSISGLWWPNEEAEAEILSADDPEAHAVKVCTTEPMRGTWAT